MWKSGALGFCRISKPGGKRGKLAWGFGVFLAFHGASFPPRFSSRCSRSAATPTFFLLGRLFSLWATIRGGLTKILRQDGSGTTISRTLDQRHLPFGSGLLTAALLAHRFTAHLDAMGVMHDSVENAVRQGRIPDLLVPLGHGQLAGQNHGPHRIAVLTDFQEIAAFGVRQWRHRPIVDH